MFIELCMPTLQMSHSKAIYMHRVLVAIMVGYFGSNCTTHVHQPTSAIIIIIMSRGTQYSSIMNGTSGV